MFRFIHAADPHLDSPLQGLEFREGAPVDLLRGATRRAFENLIQLALTEQVDFLLLAGDVYDGDWKDYGTGLFFHRQMVRLRERGIPVYLITGNHDAASVVSRKLKLPDNVHVFSTRTAESMEVPDLPAVIHGRGFPHRAVPENLAVDYPAAIPAKFNLGLLHTSLTGKPGHDTYAPCSEADLRDKGYAYWALGHIHEPEIVSRDPWIVFAGTCQGRHIRETGPRGCRLVAVNGSLEVESAEWRPLDVVRWQQLHIDLAGVEAEAELLRRAGAAMEQAVREAEGRLVAARLLLGGSTPLHGKLHREEQHCHAQLLAAAQELGAASLWVERIQIATAPVYDVARLAERDPLTRLVVESLREAGRAPVSLPGEIPEMLMILPPEIRAEIEAEWAEDRRGALLEDVRAIILETLGTGGGRPA